jgi:xylulokinase
MDATVLGLDIGTSAVKAVLIAPGGATLAEASEPLTVDRPRPLWSEQDAQAWWRAVEAAVAAIAAAAPEAFRGLGAIGLSGQMHGAVCLGDDDQPLCPVILWNDGRAGLEAAELARSRPDLARRLGVKPMAGLTAPKLLWLARHSPAVFDAIRTVLLPKDYVRLRLTGERLTDRSDAAGTWLLDQAARAWSPEAAAAIGLDLDCLPGLVEGSEPAGRLRPEIAARWGVAADVVVAGGAGDAAIGIGAVRDGDAFVSLGTSAQLFATAAAFRPNPERLVHAFCHALPGLWFQMGAMLNGASALAWAAQLAGRDVGDLASAVEAEFRGPSPVLFLPYLTGERTPHNDPHAKGVLFGLTPETGAVAVAQAVMEGVAFSLADAQAALAASGTDLGAVGFVGGGARSRLWAQIAAAVLDRPVVRFQGADKGPAHGAARLAVMALTGAPPEAAAPAPPVEAVIVPDPALVEAYGVSVTRFRRLYAALAPEFALAAGLSDA